MKKITNKDKIELLDIIIGFIGYCIFIYGPIIWILCNLRILIE